MKKLLTYVSFLLLAVSCNTNKSVVATAPKAPAANSKKAANVVKENNTDAKPVVLKRTMRRPAVI